MYPYPVSLSRILTLFALTISFNDHPKDFSERNSFNDVPYISSFRLFLRHLSPKAPMLLKFLRLLGSYVPKAPRLPGTYAPKVPKGS